MSFYDTILFKQVARSLGVDGDVSAVGGGLYVGVGEDVLGHLMSTSIAGERGVLLARV